MRPDFASPLTALAYHDVCCRHCGSLGPHTKGPGAGPHHAQLMCGGCGLHIKWLSTRTPEERAARQRHYQRAWMAQQPPTSPQLAELARLGYQGARPETRLAASDLIDGLRRGRV
jgi:hypothetical protein